MQELFEAASNRELDCRAREQGEALAFDNLAGRFSVYKFHANGGGDSRRGATF